jgi:DNA-binding transcriptional regulator of glucitol operon
MAAMRRRWTSPRALLIHLALVVSVPLFLALAWWQVHRAESGNTLSYGYAVEWPLFAVAAVYLWWYLIHMDPNEAGGTGSTADDGPEGAAETWSRRRDEESPELTAYNDDLEFLAEAGKRKTWRNPRGLP